MMSQAELEKMASLEERIKDLEKIVQILDKKITHGGSK